MGNMLEGGTHNVFVLIVLKSIREKKYRQSTKIVHQFAPLDFPNFVNKFLEGDKQKEKIAHSNFLLESSSSSKPKLRSGFIMLNVDISTSIGLFIKDNANLLRFVIAQQAGHIIGLDHSADKSSIMNDTQSFANGLGFDDYYGARYLYPAQASLDDFTDCAVLISRFNKKSLFSIFLIYLMPFFLIFLSGTRRLSFFHRGY